MPTNFSKNVSAFDYTSIPVPTADIPSLTEVTMKLKEAVEMLMGERHDVKAAAIFVQDTQPSAGSDGTFWLCTLATNLSLNISAGGKWLKVGTLT